MEPPRLSLGFFPTPIHRLDRVSADLGIDLWIKRDDLSGLALGGNKVRKLEYLLASAVAQGCDTIVTCGGLHSNFIRILAAGCAKLGLRCVATVMELPFEDEEPSGERLNPTNGNPRLSRLFGAELREFPNGAWEELYEHGAEAARAEESDGRSVYSIPIGGSSPLGAYAFWKAGQEVIASGESFDWIVTASSSGSTQTGLTYAFAGTNTNILGICSDPEPEMVHELDQLGVGLSALLSCPALTWRDFRLNLDHVGSGYGIPSQEGDEAIRYLAEKEGILLDPIYTGKAFAGMLQLINCQSIGGRVLFWHTGGAPSVFAQGFLRVLG